MKHGVVIKSTGSWFTVKYDTEIVHCKIRGKFRLKGMKATNPLAVGDYVHFEIQADGTGIITELLDRKNYIIRKSTNLSKQVHIIASNIDQCIVVAGMLMPETPLEFIDRILVTAEIYKIPAVIIFNKSDLFTPELLEYTREIEAEYIKIGYNCIETSAKTGHNLDKVATLLKDKVSLLSGNSGVGKSTLINSIDSNLNLKTGKISDAHLTGKHTTTFAEMFFLEQGGAIIDTPGLRGFGVVDLNAEDLSGNFPEFFNKSENCQYNNCTHTHEPKCAIKNAVDSGDIAWWRYRSYVSMLEGDTKHRLDDYE